MTPEGLAELAQLESVMERSWTAERTIWRNLEAENLRLEKEVNCLRSENAAVKASNIEQQEEIEKRREENASLKATATQLKEELDRVYEQNIPSRELRKSYTCSHRAPRTSDFARTGSEQCKTSSKNCEVDCKRLDTIHPKSVKWRPRKECSLYDAVGQNDLAAVRACLRCPSVIAHIDQHRGFLTPLKVAAEKGFDDIVAELLHAGADTGVIGKRAAIHVACAKNRVNVVRVLLAHGDDLHLLCSRGWTPLHWAAAEGATDVVRFLLDQAADPTIKDKDGETPAGIAKRMKNEAVLQLFRPSGKCVIQ